MPVMMHTGKWPVLEAFIGGVAVTALAAHPGEEPIG